MKIAIILTALSFCFAACNHSDSTNSMTTDSSAVNSSSTNASSGSAVTGTGSSRDTGKIAVPDNPDTRSQGEGTINSGDMDTTMRNGSSGMSSSISTSDSSNIKQTHK